MICGVNGNNFFQKVITHGKLIPFFWEKVYQFPVRNTKWLKNSKLRRAILSAFYNISQRNFGILLILWCSFKLWWHFCLDLSRSKFCSLGNRSIDANMVRLVQSTRMCKITTNLGWRKVGGGIQTPVTRPLHGVRVYIYLDCLNDIVDLYGLLVLCAD
jgi:hypothetical protein